MKERPLSARNQAILDGAKSKGIDPDVLIRHYGRKFTLKLIKHFTKPPNARFDSADLIYPKFDPHLTQPHLAESTRNNYLMALEKAGFRKRIWMESFVIQETGEVGGRERFDYYYIGHEAEPVPTKTKYR